MASPVDQFNKMADFITGRMSGEVLQAAQSAEDFDAAKQELLERIKEIQSKLSHRRSEGSIKFFEQYLAAEARRDALSAEVKVLEGSRAELQQGITEAKERNHELLEKRAAEAKTQEALRNEKWTAVTDMDRVTSAMTSLQFSLGGSS